MDTAAPKLRLEAFLPYRLTVLTDRVSHSLSKVYAHRHGITNPEWRVIATLGQYPSMTAKQIGIHSHMHKTKVSRAVATLERRKVVKRQANVNDRREAHLTLTAAGRAVYDDLAPLALDFSDRLLAPLNDRERHTLDLLLTKLTDRSLQLSERIAGGDGHEAL